MRRLHADLLLLFAAAIWGFAFLFQKSAMLHMGPLMFIAARSGVACVALFPLARRELRQHARGTLNRIARAAIPAGLAFFLGAVLQQIGIVTATVTNTGFLTALYVVLTPLVVWTFMRIPPAFTVWPAVVLSFVGTWLLGGGTLSGFSFGDFLVALSALFWAIHVVVLARAARFRAPVTFTAVQFAVVAVLAFASASLFETISLAQFRNAAVEIAFVGLLSSALTFSLFAVALRYTAPSEAAIIVSTETLFAAFGAYLFLGERLSWIGWTGAAMILAAILTVQLNTSRHERSDQPG